MSYIVLVRFTDGKIQPLIDDESEALEFEAAEEAAGEAEGDNWARNYGYQIVEVTI